MKRPRWVLTGDRVRPAAGAQVAVWSPAVRWGAGLYETVGCMDGSPLLYARHLDRLRSGALALEWELPPLPDAAAAMRLLARENLSGAAALRLLVVLAGPRRLHAVAWAERFRPPRRLRREGATLLPVELPAGPLAGVKTCDRFALRWASRRAQAARADAALLVDSDGAVRESDHANVFAAVNGTVVTPPSPRRCLPGVIRRWTTTTLRTAGVAVVERDLTLAELLAANGAWLTSSLEGIVPVREIAGTPLPRPAAILQALHAAGIPAPGYAGGDAARRRARVRA
jgi:branched-subunit amino acid aminotransferase/4-amino-4-deoxychorismate lyase